MLRFVVGAIAAFSVLGSVGAEASDRVHAVRATARTALPAVPPGTRVSNVRSARQRRRATIAADDGTRADYASALAAAQSARDTLAPGPARDELAGTIANAEELDARGLLSESRLAPVTEILRRNTEFWPASAVPEPGSRFTFGSSPVIFEYYPGEGLQLQPLATFGKANAAWRTCRSRGDRECPALRALLDGMLALAAQRAGFTTWEYYFDFEGGVPPWISGMAQATGVQALSRAYRLTGDSRYRAAASAALGAFETAPPLGVAIPATGGTHYLQYSYAPGLFIFNGFIQTLVGLFDYQSNTGDERGAALFRSGDGHGRWLIPQSDTGSWSLYSLGGPLSTLEYHTLLRDFLRNLCGRTDATVYCTTADRFTAYLTAPPPPPAPPASPPESPAPAAPPAAVAVAGVATPPQALTPPAATNRIEAARPALRAWISPGRHVLMYTVARRSHLRARVQARRAGRWRTAHLMRGLPGSPGRHRVRLRDTPRHPWRVVLERTSRAGRVLERVVVTGR